MLFLILFKYYHPTFVFSLFSYKYFLISSIISSLTWNYLQVHWFTFKEMEIFSFFFIDFCFNSVTRKHTLLFHWDLLCAQAHGLLRYTFHVCMRQVLQVHWGGVQLNPLYWFFGLVFHLLAPSVMKRALSESPSFCFIDIEVVLVVYSVYTVESLLMSYNIHLYILPV